jgi:NADH dehydrogenase FAD-containing subunit
LDDVGTDLWAFLKSLLNDSAVGTLEFRHVLESVRKRRSHVDFLQGWADNVDFAAKTVTIEPNVLDESVGHALVGEREAAVQVPAERFVLGGPAQPGGTGQKQVPTFPIKYDKLIIAVGCYSQTFGTEGVRENALFLKDVNDARRIRRRVLDLFELCKMPILPEQTKRWLLHFAIVGGGPTGMEFAASLSDLIEQDLARMYPDLMQYVRISLYDVAPKVLPMFDKSLADYAVQQYKRHNVEIKTSHHVKRLRKGFPDDPVARDNQDSQIRHRVYTIETEEDGDTGIGMCVWSTGNMSNPFVAKALDSVRRFPANSATRILPPPATPSAEKDHANPISKQSTDEKEKDHHWLIQRDAKTGLILVDDHFRVQLQTKLSGGPSSSNSFDNAAEEAHMNDVFAIGDTTIMKSGRLPGTAQVANQQAHWLARSLNSSSSSSVSENFDSIPGFGYRDLGVMTYLGASRAVLQAPKSKSQKAGNNENGDEGQNFQGIRGWVAYVIWRGAYLTFTLSWRNKLLVPIQWAVVKVFGRDVSRF